MTPATQTPSNLGDFSSAPSRSHLRGPGGSYNFRLLPEEVLYETTPEVIETVTSLDITADRITTAGTRTDFIAEVLRPKPGAGKAVTVTSTDTGIISNPVSGVCTGIADGSAYLVGRSADGEVSAGRVDVRITGPTTTYAWTGQGVAGSLLKHCNDQVESRIAGRGRDSMDLWSTRNDATGQYTWNPNCWGADLSNKTCMSPWNSSYGNGAAGVLITPRHVLCTQHYGYYPQVGSTIRFVRPDNVTENFTVSSLLVHPAVDRQYLIRDQVILKLDRDVPESIQFATLLPSDPKPYLPSIQDNPWSPRASIDGLLVGPKPILRGCHTTHFKRLATSWVDRIGTEQFNPPYDPQVPFRTMVAAWAGRVDASGVDPENPYGSVNPDTPWRIKAGWRYGANLLGDFVVPGASGSPAFIIVNDKLVLTHVWTGGWYGHNTASDSMINDMLTDLGGGYQLTRVDLSGFNTYP